MIVASVRARLALWYTAALAVLLVAFAASAYAFVAHAVAGRTDRSLTDALFDLRDALLAERGPDTRTPPTAREALSDMRSRAIAFIVFDSAGRVVASAVPPPPRPSGDEDSEPAFDPRRLAPLLRTERVIRPAVRTLPDPEGGYRAALAPLTMPDGRFTIATATSMHDDAEMLGQAWAATLVAIPAALVLAWLGGWLLARRSLAPMVAIGDTTARISAATLGARVPIANPHDEVGQLAAVINGLLERLERAFTQQRQFMADASHELRTPVAVVQSEVSRALSREERSAAEYADALVVVRAAARRLRRIVDDLFLLARADAGELPVRRDPVYLDDIVQECAREVRSLAAERGVTVAVETPSEAPSTGDEALLRRLLINLLDNAIKHSPRGAVAAVRLTGLEGDYRIAVENQGEPIAPDLAPRIFDRFARGDTARSRDERDERDDAAAPSSGAGLGLAIARWIATAHHGTLRLERSDQASTVFVLRLPRAYAAGPAATSGRSPAAR